jgi:hypothetical protein
VTTRRIVAALAMGIALLSLACSSKDDDGASASTGSSTTDREDPDRGPPTTRTADAPEETLAPTVVPLSEWVAAADAQCREMSAAFAALGEPDPEARAVEQFLRRAAALLDDAATDVAAVGTPDARAELANDIVQRWRAVRDLYGEAARDLSEGAPLDGEFMVGLQQEVAAAFDPMYAHLDTLGITGCTTPGAGAA